MTYFVKERLQALEDMQAKQKFLEELSKKPVSQDKMPPHE
jgi:hypothetical protein